MFLPEYGRHIHEMIDYLNTIEDRDERTRQAYIVIDVMGNLNPLLRDTSDIAHKLWDHLFIMSDFSLDVDSPYPIPTRQDLRPRPDKLSYPRKDMMFKHYGKNVERMIDSLKGNDDKAAVEATLEDIARYMRTKSYEYNQEHPNNEIIINDIKRLSHGELAIDEEALGNIKSEYRQPSPHPSSGPHSKKNRQGQKNQNSKQRRGPRTFGVIVAVLLACTAMVSCTREKARLGGQFIGVTEQPVYLERVLPVQGASVVDSTLTDRRGAFSFKFSLPEGQPTIFNLRNGDDMVPLLVSPGEKVSVMSLGDLGRGYRVSGSPESQLVWELHGILTRGASALDSISGLFALLPPEDSRRGKLSKAYFDKYYETKREQIRFIVENSGSLAAIYALYQRLPGDDVLFNGDTDFVYYQMVADSVRLHYPDSRYTLALEREIGTLEADRRARSRLGENLSQISYPDIELPNMYGQKIRLSSLAGKVIVLDFWSATQIASNVNNAEMKELWNEYSSEGLAIYQVSLDTSKPTWVNAVQEQRLPWVSVCDFRGEMTPAAGVYNISTLPTNFIIDREGDIVAKNLYGAELAAKIKELL